MEGVKGFAKAIPIVFFILTGMARASTIYVQAPTPFLRDQLENFVIQQGGAVVVSQPSDYAITVTTNSNAMTGSHINPVPFIISGATAAFARGPWRYAGLLSFLFSHPVVRNKPKTNVAVIFTQGNRLVDDVTAVANDSSDETIFNALRPYGNRITGWIRSTETADSLPDEEPQAEALPPAYAPPAPQENRAEAVTPTDFSIPAQEPPEPEAQAPVQTCLPDHCTGLIVETSGFKVSRGMSPHIWDETGRIIYGVFGNGRIKEVMKVGVVGYEPTLEKALQNRRSGPNPLIVHIVNINANPGNYFPKDVVVSKEDGDRILQADKSTHFLNRFHVIFITDPRNL